MSKNLIELHSNDFFKVVENWQGIVQNISCIKMSNIKAYFKIKFEGTESEILIFFGT